MAPPTRAGSLAAAFVLAMSCGGGRPGATPTPETMDGGGATSLASSVRPKCDPYLSSGALGPSGFFPISHEPKPLPKVRARATEERPVAADPRAFLGKKCVCGNGKIDRCAVSDHGGCSGVGHPCDPGPVQITVDAEECDGAQLNGATCETLGFSGGRLSCTQCQLDVSRCGVCPNGVPCVSLKEGGVGFVAANDSRIFVSTTSGVARLDEHLSTLGSDGPSSILYRAIGPRGLHVVSLEESAPLGFAPNDGSFVREAWRAPSGHRIDGLYELRKKDGTLEDPLVYTTDYAHGRATLHFLGDPARTVQFHGPPPLLVPGPVIDTEGGLLFRGTLEGVQLVRPDGTVVLRDNAERCVSVSLTPTPVGIYASSASRLRTVDADLSHWGKSELDGLADGTYGFYEHGHTPSLLPLADGVIASLGDDTWVRFGRGKPYAFKLRYGDVSRFGSESAAVFHGKIVIAWSSGAPWVGLFEVPPPP